MAIEKRKKGNNGTETPILSGRPTSKIKKLTKVERVIAEHKQEDDQKILTMLTGIEDPTQIIIILNELKNFIIDEEIEIDVGIYLNERDNMGTNRITFLDLTDTQAEYLDNILRSLRIIGFPENSKGNSNLIDLIIDHPIELKILQMMDFSTALEEKKKRELEIQKYYEELKEKERDISELMNKFQDVLFGVAQMDVELTNEQIKIRNQFAEERREREKIANRLRAERENLNKITDEFLDTMIQIQNLDTGEKITDENLTEWMARLKEKALSKNFMDLGN